MLRAPFTTMGSLSTEVHDKTGAPLVQLAPCTVAVLVAAAPTFWLTVVVTV